MGDDETSDVLAIEDALLDMVPMVYRILGVSVVIWYSTILTKNERFYAGLLSSILAFAVCLSLLGPLFLSVGMELASVALYFLSVWAALVGMSLGVLLPNFFMGVTAAVSLSWMAASLAPLWSDLVFLGVGVLVIGMSAFCFRGRELFLLAVATSIVSGAIISSLAFDPLLPYILNVARGYEFEMQHSGISVNASPIPTVVNYSLVLYWFVGTCFVGIVLAYRDEKLRQVVRRGVMTETPPPPPFQPPQVPPQTPATQSPPETYNMFDPADLPPRLAEYADAVYTACEDLGNFFGFQDSSVRNQAEHLLILVSNNRRFMNNHIVPPPMQPPSPIHALHAKVFSNYRKWCRAMRIPPNFKPVINVPGGVGGGVSGASSVPPAVESRVYDLVLFFCVWGEASNIRHMPECLWFLYHKMMEEYIVSYSQTRSFYAGHYVDYVVRPIYDLLNKNLKSKEDHVNKRNYDDFNEFFWNRECLRYHYSSYKSSSLDSTADNNDLEGSGVLPLLPGDNLPPIRDGLFNAPKTFLEKRSWLSGILALYRVLEWHIVTFYLLTACSFAKSLVWTWVYTVKVTSGVFWVMNFMALQWNILEVWSAYPGLKLSDTTISGSAFGIVARFLILVYQTLALMWTFGPHHGKYLGVEADANFWWWQYVWLSLLVSIPWAIEALLQFVPEWTTKIFTSQNDILQSFLNLSYPISRLYVAKEVHESLGHSVYYTFYWITLIILKLSFSFTFEVLCMVLPTMELTDDYFNYPDQSFWKMALLLGSRWFPQLIVYLIDMSIWYSVWQAMAGTAVGLSERLGDVRDINDIRLHFGKASENFCKKMLSTDAGSRRGSSASILGASTNSMPDVGGGGERQPLLGADPHKLTSYVNRLLDVRIQKWVMFSAAWNEIIDHFRAEDIVSNRERDYLKFSRFDGFSQAIYLPVFQTAGVIENVILTLDHPHEEGPGSESLTDEMAFKHILEHVTMRTAVSEVWELGNYVFMQMFGSLHQKDVDAITNLILKWTESGKLLDHIRVENMRSVMVHFVALIKILEKGIGRRKPSTKPRLAKSKQFMSAAATVDDPSKTSKIGDTVAGMRKAVSATFLSNLDPKGSSDPALTMQKTSKASLNGTARLVIIDALRDQARDKFRLMAHAVKKLVKGVGEDDESRDVVDRITFLLSMENGFFWDDAYASDQLDIVCKSSTFKGVVTKLHGLVACDPDEVEPKSKEVRRRLAFFVNSLFMDMPNAPSIHDMFSWNVLTPYYSEDVIYNKQDLEKRTDALGVSTLLYLQTLYRSDWNNFLERLGIEDEEKIWSKKYIEETRIWASIRAQTLSRTVNGMMYFEKALRLLANLERLDEDTTQDLMGEKFGYVVSCQVYGNMKKNQDSKAEDIDNLMHRHPHLRIAYIDSVRLNRSGATEFFSVLLKSDGRGSIQEIYRVKLPGNPVLGEGKPENQNHAMIFTRGEFLQAIDMNQEGYFEEALKMRNALQEFAKRESPLPTTILGLREHIFTGSVSSLANYMALQENSFVSQGQRVLTNPLRMRLHYGHPDVFDKLFFITRGGISKSSKGINLSEDIFAGYSCVVRGGSIGFKEYLQVGKGRDVGMSQIYKFEAKLSQGAAEQSISRDVYRMCHRLDFFRLLSFYFGGIGHYFSNVLTVFTVYVVVYLMGLLALYELEIIGDRVITPMGTIQMLLGGLGLLQTIPLFATLGVERGWWPSFLEIVQVFITGGPMHFMFHIQTKANYMAQTILVGGAKYRPTGRGFVTQHTAMDEQYRFFASSHLYLGFELALGLILMGVYTEAGQYFGRTWSLWLASISFLASPFWFNPLTFEWNVVSADYIKWLQWILGRHTGGAAKQWSVWWNEENSFYGTMPLASKAIYLIKAVIFFLMSKGVLQSDLLLKDVKLNKPPISLTTMTKYLAIFSFVALVFGKFERSLAYPVRRLTGVVITIGMIYCVSVIYVENPNMIRYTISAYYGVGAVCLFGLLVGLQKFVQPFYFVHDLVIGHLIFIPLFILAILQFPSLLQTWLLYHNALSSDVVVSDILRYARKNQEAGGGPETDEDLVEQVAELKKLVLKQEEMLSAAGLMPSNDLPVTRNASTDAITSLVTPGGEEAVVPSAEDGGLVATSNRAVSMTGLDVWGGMALGDMDNQQQQHTRDGAGTSTSQAFGFQFSQPDTMPPR